MNESKIKVVVKNLTKKFNDLLVLDNMSFNIKKGEFLCIVGPTGCGKTTFLNLLSCLEETTSGDIYIDDEKANPKKHSLAFVFQEPSTFPWLNVEQNIQFGLDIKKMSKKEKKEKVDNIISLMGIEKFRKSYLNELSVSTEQRLAIGRAFAMNPDLLLMDEPYGHMDIKMRFYLEDEVIRLWRELRTTVIFITHNIEEAIYLAERIIILSSKPTTIKEEIILDLPRPRDIKDKKFIELRKYITDQIKWW